MVAARRLRGFSLVELLIAVAIFALVIGVATYGFSLFSRHWYGRSGGFDRAQHQYQRLALVAAALEDTLPWAVRDATGAPGFYFLGRDEGLTLVTGSPVFSPGSVAVIRLFREPDGADRWKVVYEEAPIDAVLLREANQTLPFAHRMVVLRLPSPPTFRYFGWQSLEVRLAAADGLDPQQKAEWSSDFDGLTTRQHPQRIALALGGAEAVFFIPERADVSFRRYLGPE